MLFCSETIARVTGGMKVKADRDEVSNCCCSFWDCYGSMADIRIMCTWGVKNLITLC